MDPYSLAVTWIWTLAVVATLVALGLAWRALSRADHAVDQLRDASQGLVPIPVSTAATRDEVVAAVRRRQDLADRSAEPSG